MPTPTSGLPLDSAPSSPPSLGAQAHPASFGGLAPTPDQGIGNGMQTLQLLLQTAQAVAQGLDVLGKMEPALAGLSAQMQQQLRDGVQAALQQGSMGGQSPAGATFAGMGGVA